MSTSRLSGVRKYKPKATTVEAIPWTGRNFEDVVLFTGRRRLESGQIGANFRAYAGLPPAPYAGGEVYDSALNIYVPIEIGEWILKDAPWSLRIVDPTELSELYRKI